MPPPHLAFPQASFRNSLSLSVDGGVRRVAETWVGGG
jgi:hypothetical protein